MNQVHEPSQPQAAAAPGTTQPPVHRSPRWLVWAAGVGSVALLVVALLLARSMDPEKMRAYGYFGVFVFSLVTSATLVLPAPTFAGVVAGSTFLNPILVGLTAGAAMALGESTGYLVGRAARAVAPDALHARGWTGRINRLVQRHGAVGLAVVAFVPNPFFDVAGLAAGALRMRFLTFLLAVGIGKTARAVLLALATAGSVGWLARFA